MTIMKNIDDQDYIEISRLNNELVNTQRELAKRNVELERLKSSLETVVADRTAALVNINKQLSTELFERRVAEESLRISTIRLEVDIAERKQVEAALRESEEKFRNIISQSNDGIRLINSQGIVCEWNSALEKITGQKREDVMGKPFSQVGFENVPDEFRTPEFTLQFREKMQAQLEAGQLVLPFTNSIYEIKHMNGTRRLVQTVVSCINTSQGPMLCGVVRDMTELKQREEELDFAHRELAKAYDLTLEGWSRTLEIRERETAGHCKRVVDLTCRIAQKMGVPNSDMIHLRRGALLHDIGKIGIPDKLLLKPDALNEEEWRVMKLHPIYALTVLKDIPYLQPALDIPYCHHEKWDGTGYPRGLAGEEIPLAARMFALSDVYDALTSDRPYRKAWSHEKTLEYINQQTGLHFEPRLVVVFLELMNKEKDNIKLAHN